MTKSSGVLTLRPRYWAFATIIAFGGGAGACTCSQSERELGRIDSPIGARVTAVEMTKLDVDGMVGGTGACVWPKVDTTKDVELVVDTAPETRIEFGESCASYELSAAPDKTRIGYRCKDTGDAPWTVMYLRPGGRAFRSTDEIKGPIDWPKIPDFAAASPNLFRAFAESSVEKEEEASAFAREITRSLRGKEMARFLAETADSNAPREASCDPNRSSYWRDLFDRLSKQEKKDVVLSLEAGLRRKETKAGAILKAALLVDIDAADLQDDLARRAEDLASLEQHHAEAVLGHLLVRLVRQRPAQAGVIACEALTRAQEKKEPRQLAPGDWFLNRMLFVVAAAKTPCPAVLAHVKGRTVCDDDWFCESPTSKKTSLCPVSHFEAQIKKYIDRTLEKVRAESCGEQNDVAALAGAAHAQGKLPDDIDRRLNRRTYVVGPAPAESKSAAALPACFWADEGVACACGADAGKVVCEMDPEQREISMANIRCRFAVDDAKRRIVVTSLGRADAGPIADPGAD